MPVFVSKPTFRVPENAYAQSEILSWMLSDSRLSEINRRKLNRVYNDGGIKNRHSVLQAFRTTTEQNSIYAASTQTRMELFREHALPFSIQVVQDFLSESDINPSLITHLVWVSCTGLMAPGPESILRQSFRFHPLLQTTAFNFLGCHGFFHALRFGSSIVEANPEAKVLVVCLEFCTLHFQPNDSDDRILANSLFADGAAVTMISGLRPKGKAIQVIKYYQSFFANASDEMAWKLGETGFDMRLARNLPESVVLAVRACLKQPIPDEISSLKEIKHWLVHPGGKRILDLMEKDIPELQNKLETSRSILRDFGNVSSASVLFALRRFLENEKAFSGESGFLMGIGPGLSLEASLFVV
jgi:predicted naringenin-chalcone synthase